MSLHTCETCKHWKRNPGNKYTGDCCIRAPWVIADPDGAMPYTWFPYTLSSQGCGQHEPKDIETTAEGGA